MRRCWLVCCALLFSCDQAKQPPQQRSPTTRSAPTSVAAKPLAVNEASFFGPGGHREQSRFARGEQIQLLVTVAGYTQQSGRISLQGSLRVTGAKGRPVLTVADISLADKPVATSEATKSRVALQFQLPAATPPGAYTLNLQIRDRAGGGAGTLQAGFTLLGDTAPAVASLDVNAARIVGDRQLPPGSVVSIAANVLGLTSTKQKEQQKLSYVATLNLLDAQGQVKRTQTQPVEQMLLFTPPSVPLFRHLQLPKDLAAGAYQVKLHVLDRVNKATKETSLPLRVAPTKFAIYNPMLLDGAGLPRREFLAGEQILARFSLQGFATRKERADLVVDLAIAGPNGGVYFAKQAAAESKGIVARQAAHAGRFPVDLPLTLPNLAAEGEYRVVLRAFDRIGKQRAVREYAFQLRGSGLSPLGQFKVDKLSLRRRADLPLSDGATLRIGQAYHVTVRVGGAKLKPVRRLTWQADLIGSIKLRAVRGGSTTKQQGVFKFNRTLNYVPIRIPLTADWAVPDHLAPGDYNLIVSVLNRATDRVSQLQRRVELIGGGSH